VSDGPRSILIVNPFGLGDVLFATPLARALRHRFPDSRITFLCNARTVELLETNRYLSGVLVFDSGEWKRQWHGTGRAAAWRSLRGLWRALRGLRCDLLLDLSLEGRYSAAAWLLGIRRRIGFDVKGRGRWLTERHPLRGYEGRHVVEHYLSLGASLGVTPDGGGLDLALTEEDRRAAGRCLAEAGIADGEPLVALAPGGGASWGAAAINKQWPPNRFAEAGRVLRQHGRIVLLGSREETALCNGVAEETGGGTVSLAGRTTVRQAAALLRRCRLLVCNDGGMLHLALTQGTPTVSIFGPVDERVYGPYPAGAGHVTVVRDLPCHPCYRAFRMPPCPYDLACLRGLETSVVVQTAERLLQTSDIRLQT
jgi:lipopolysaccharide heptosyltransferase II